MKIKITLILFLLSGYCLAGTNSSEEILKLLKNVDRKEKVLEVKEITVFGTSEVKKILAHIHEFSNLEIVHFRGYAGSLLKNLNKLQNLKCVELVFPGVVDLEAIASLKNIIFLKIMPVNDKEIEREKLLKTIMTLKNLKGLDLDIYYGDNYVDQENLQQVIDSLPNLQLLTCEVHRAQTRNLDC